MPARRTTDCDIDDLPLAFRRGLGLDRTWVRSASCIRHPAVVDSAWKIAPNESRQVGDATIPGHVLIKMAVMVCHGCPVQYRCAEYAIEADMQIGTWGLPFKDLRWLGRQSDWQDILGAGEAAGATVDEYVRAARKPRARAAGAA